MTIIGDLIRRPNGLAAALAAALAVLPQAAPAQDQPEASASQQLNEALRSLAQDPQYLPSLLSAAQASLVLDDVDSALGFFRRAEAVAPTNGSVKAGLAAVMVRQGQALDALRLFAEAEQAGEPMHVHAVNRGLAYDLIGDNARAQQEYQAALTQRSDPLVLRRLAISQAIAGNQSASEATLLPMLQRSDLAAYRTRAFALAIGGKADEAVTIAQTMLPARLSSRIAPYLRYMPRLTRAQQAAAANLGTFPQAAQIGREDPLLAAYAAQAGLPPTARGGADARLVPSGQALGSRPNDSRIPQREENPRLTSATPAAPTPVAPPPAVATPAPPPPPVQTTRAAPVPAQEAPPQRPPAAAPVVAAVSEVPPPQATPSAPRAFAAPGERPTPPPEESRPPAVIVAALPSPPPQAEAPPPSVVLAAQESAPPAAVPAQVPQRDLVQTFAEFAVPPRPAVPAQGAVDVTRIEPRREAPPVQSRPVPPPKPVVPSRHWVQVATGRDVAALAFDWRRVKRGAGGLLDRTSAHVAAWGQTNRLVAGPFASAREANELVTKLKEKEVDSFRFTSEQGEEVRKLD